MRRAYLGLSAQTTPIPRRFADVLERPAASAAMVSSVEKDGPAAQAGLKSGDLILKVDELDVAGVDDLIRILNAERVGRTIAVDVLRGGVRKRIWAGPVERKA